MTLPSTSPTPGNDNNNNNNNNTIIIILVTGPFDLQHRDHPRTPATHHYLFAFALEQVPSSASAVQPPTTRPRGFRSARTSTSDTTPRAKACSYFAQGLPGTLQLSFALLLSVNLTPNTSYYCYTTTVVLSRRHRLATLITRLIYPPNVRSTLNPQLGHRSVARSPTHPLSSHSLCNTRPSHHH